MYTYLHVTSVTELDNPLPMEKFVLVSAASVAVVLFKFDVRDWFVAWRPIKSVTLMNPNLKMRWIVKENARQRK